MTRPRRKCRRGMSLVEVMISTAIASLLLTAAAAAYVASANAVEINDQVFRATQAARVSVLQMTTQIRTCQAISVPSATQLDIITYDGGQYVYEYSAGTRQLLLIDNGQNPPVTNVLANNVASASFAADSAPNPQTDIQCVVRVTLQVNVQIGNNSVTISGAAAPRVNVNY